MEPTAPCPASLRVALLAHRGNPYTGGQGVYVKYLSRELVRLGHRVHVFSGPPFPDLDDGVDFTPVPGLDLYRDGDPSRRPPLRRFRSAIDVLEWATLFGGVYPEPLAFSLRAQARLRRSPVPFDVVHDNADLGYGLLGLRRGAPVVATVHHPATVDREFDVAAEEGWYRRLAMRHWYSFTRMQGRVARRLSGLATVSHTSRAAIVDAFRVPAERVRVIEVGVDEAVFTPPPEGVRRTPGRVVTVASSEGPLKGLEDLFETVARLRLERPVEFVVVGTPRPGGRTERALDRLALRDVVRFESRLSPADLAALIGSAQVAVVPSRYEGFSLPVVEAMATATPLVVTAAGAIPEVAGAPETTALHVPPGDPAALASAVGRLLDDPLLCRRLGDAGRRRVLERFTWRRTAQRTARWYEEMILSGAAVPRRG